MFFLGGKGGVLLLLFHGSQNKSFRAARMLNLGRNRKRSGEGAWGEGNGFSYFPNHNRTDTLKTTKKNCQVRRLGKIQSKKFSRLKVPALSMWHFVVFSSMFKCTLVSVPL